MYHRDNILCKNAGFVSEEEVKVVNHIFYTDTKRSKIDYKLVTSPHFKDSLKLTYQYDTEGNISAIEKYDLKKKSLVDIHKFQYKYDEKGNWIEQIKTSEKEKENYPQHIYREITYYD